MARETILRGVRVDKDLNEWFDTKFSWRGAFPSFVNDCLAELRKSWGDQPSPGDLVPEVVERAKARLA